MISHENPEIIIEQSNADFYLIIFIASNGHHYVWKQTGFSTTPLTATEGSLYMNAIKKQDALNEFHKALNHAQKLFAEGGTLKITPLPKFE